MKRNIIFLIFVSLICATCDVSPCDPCNGIGSWDTRNCFLQAAPPNSNPYIQNNKFYFKSANGAATGCPVGSTWDGSGGCFVRNVPAGRQGFIYNNNLYLARLCDDPNWPKKRVFIEYIKITDKKDKSLFNGKDDVQFVGALYDNGQCTFLPFHSTNSIQISKSQVNQTLCWGIEVTDYSHCLKPNQTIAIVIYEHDYNGVGQWNFNPSCANGKLTYSTHNQPYGTFYIHYGDFTDSAIKEYSLPFGWVKIKCTN